eukprot:2427483-Lingulodinium_polyedra.AAC.1
MTEPRTYGGLLGPAPNALARPPTSMPAATNAPQVSAAPGLLACPQSSTPTPLQGFSQSHNVAQ